MNAFLVAALVLFAAGAARADDVGGDSKIMTGGGDPPPAPLCNEFEGTASAGGTVSGVCTVAPDTIATSITFATPVADLLGSPPALTCTSDLTTIGWTESSSLIDAGTVDECTFTAPSAPPWGGLLAYLATPAGAWAYLSAVSQDGDPFPYSGQCDLTDFLLGIPGAYEDGNGSQGCDITFATPAGASIGNTEAFAADSEFAISPTGVGGLAALPEPGTLAMLLLGLVPLAFLRRRAVER
jgi:hypothetical protein